MKPQAEEAATTATHLLYEHASTPEERDRNIQIALVQAQLSTTYMLMEIADIQLGLLVAAQNRP